MSRADVSAVLITRDDPHAIKSIASICDHVAEVIVVDTGSAELPLSELEAEQAGAKQVVYTDCNDESGRMADFSAAREFAFSLATRPTIIWFDSDDRIENCEALDRVVKDARKAAGGKDFRVFAPYEYAYDWDGDCSLLQGRERIVNRDAWTWSRPIHEGLVPKDAKKPHVDLIDERVIWKHQRTKNKNDNEIVNHRDANRNLRILEAYYRSGQDDARIHLDLGTEYSIRAQITTDNEAHREHLHTLAHRHLTIALGRSPNRMDAFRAHLELSEVALRRAGLRTYLHRHPFDPTEAEEHTFAALRIQDQWETAYFAVARLAYATASSGLLSDKQRRKLEEKTIHYARLGLESKPVPLPYAHNPLDRKVAVHEWLHDCLARTGDVTGALAEVETALLTKPTHLHLRHARYEYETHLCRSRILADVGRMHALSAVDDSIYEVVRAGVCEPKELKARLLTVAHGPSREDRKLPTVLELDAILEGRGPLDIVFSCGTTLEPWNPDIYAERGLGGSETAVIEMAKRLVALGHEVRVYCTCGEEMEREGVKYLHAGKVFASPACDVLIAWRNANLLEPDNGPLSVRARMLWVHDVDPAAMNPGRALLADRVFALSDWHRDSLIENHRFHPAQVIKTRNGLDLSRFEVEGIERHPHRAVWSSSFDRGLPTLLDYWQDIRKEIPDAELHIFYGNEAHKKAAAHLKNTEMSKWISDVEERIESMADHGVVYRGRVEQRELAKEFMAAGCWLYPTSFTETFCITAAEAQAAGLAIVASEVAALRETVIHGRTIPGSPDDDQSKNGQSFRESFIEGAVYAMETPEQERLNVIGDAKLLFSWQPVAEQWVDEFRAALSAAESGDLVPYVAQAAE